jgi:hypothetical protein
MGSLPPIFPRFATKRLRVWHPIFPRFATKRLRVWHLWIRLCVTSERLAFKWLFFCVSSIVAYTLWVVLEASR